MHHAHQRSERPRVRARILGEHQQIRELAACIASQLAEGRRPAKHERIAGIGGDLARAGGASSSSHAGAARGLGRQQGPLRQSP